MNSKVVFVDDEPAVLRALGRDVKSWLGDNDLDLVGFSSGEECLSFLNEYASDVLLVVSDLRMPGIKGSDLLYRISEEYPDIGLILMTAYTDMEDITHAVSASLYGLVMKPWRTQKFISELDRAKERVLLLREQRKSQERIKEQLENAADFQYRFLHDETPDIDSLVVEVRNVPAPTSLVTGDYYDVIKLDKDRIVLIVGEVGGRGIQPAFVTGILKTYTKELWVRYGQVEARFPADDFLVELNNKLVNILPKSSGITVAMAVALVDLKNFMVQHVSAGHLPLVLVREGQTRRAQSTGPELGVTRNAPYGAEFLELVNGDRLVLYTDGVPSWMFHDSVGPEALFGVFTRADLAGDFFRQIDRIVDASKLLHTTRIDPTMADDATILTAKIIPADEKA